MKNCTDQAWISLILRTAIASLFAVAAIAKFAGGLEASASSITGMFAGTFLPAALVGLYANLLPFAEAAVAIWLILGVKLKEAWISTAFLLISLGFGLLVAKQSAADIHIYVLIACIGLHFSSHDSCCLIKGKK